MRLYRISTKAINECTSVGVSIKSDIILAKNRDRTYNPTIQLVRDMINGIEVLYMYDVGTDYSEGMNEHGVGIVNTTLQGKEDEKEIKLTTASKKLNADGHKIRKALGYDDIDKIVESLDLFKRGLGGHTTVGYKKGFVSIEKIRMGKPKIEYLDKNEIVVRTNHGIGYPDQGYQGGTDRESSVSRSFYAHEAAKVAKSDEDLLTAMRTHHDLPGYLEPYRTNYKVWTSTQILMNLSKLQMYFVVDENTKFIGIEDRLPKNYKKKIKLKIYQLHTEYKAESIYED